MTYRAAYNLAYKQGYRNKEGVEAYDDHEFWKAFSTAMGWKEPWIDDSDPHKALEESMSLELPIWHIKYMSFKDHTLAGNSPESWFKWVDLTQNPK